MAHELSIDTKKLLAETANETVAEIAILLGGEHLGKGGYFRAFILLGGPGAPFAHLVELAEFWAGNGRNVENLHKYRIVSMEKSIRVVDAPRLDVYSSFTYRRDTSQNRYGGAILFEATIPDFGEAPVWIVFSFSGLPELGDEASMALLAMRMPWKVKVNHLKSMLDASGNQIGLNLLEKEFLQKE